MNIFKKRINDFERILSKKKIRNIDPFKSDLDKLYSLVYREVKINLPNTKKNFIDTGPKKISQFPVMDLFKQKKREYDIFLVNTIQICNKLNDVFKNLSEFVVIHRKPFFDYLEAFLRRGPRYGRHKKWTWGLPDLGKAISIYPLGIMKNFLIEIRKWEYTRGFLPPILEYSDIKSINSSYGYELKRLEIAFEKINRIHFELLKQFQRYRNHLLYWVYNKEYEIVSITPNFVRLYLFNQNISRDYYMGKGVFIKKRFGYNFFMGDAFKIIPVPIIYVKLSESSSSRKLELEEYLWYKRGLKEPKSIDLVLLKEPRIDSTGYFYIENRVENIMYAMDFENNILRVIKKLFKKKKMNE